MDNATSFRLVCRPADHVLFRLKNATITTADFLVMAHRLAGGLPAGDHVVNLCHDRLHFAVGLAAALLRGQVSLLTSDRSPERLRSLLERYPGLYSLSNSQMTANPLPHHKFRAHPPRASAGEPDNPEIPAAQLAAIVFTSGSTGEPVGHEKSWGALVERSIDASVCFNMTETKPTSIVGMVPPQHMYGFETTVLLPLHAPVSTWCGAAFFPEDVASALRAVPAPRVLVTTPLQIRALLQNSTELAPLERVISATAPLFPDMATAAERRWNTRVFEIFGATEVGSIASRRTIKGDIWTTYPHVRVREDQAGAIVEGPFAVPHALSDVVEILDARHFRLLGRRADLIKMAGRRASLAELNSILVRIEGVRDGQFVAPDDLDQRPTARLLVFVVAPERSAEEIMADLRGQIDPPFLPRRIIRVDQLPRNELGKMTEHAVGVLKARVNEA
jgi:acyl-coenzyme A synthetase/AMP-(fatty) acid ligase